MYFKFKKFLDIPFDSNGNGLRCHQHSYRKYFAGSLFDEDEWQRVISNIEPGNKIKVVVGFTNEFIVKMTPIYLVYEEQIDEKMKHFHEPDENGIVSSGDENVSNVMITRG